MLILLMVQTSLPLPLRQFTIIIIITIIRMSALRSHGGSVGVVIAQDGLLLLLLLLSTTGILTGLVLLPFHQLF